MAKAGTVTTTDASVEATTFYNKNLLKRALANLVFYKYGTKKPIPRNSGNKINFRGFSPLAPSTTPLTEGVTPDGKKNEIYEIESTLQQYGDYVEYSDVLDLVGIDPYVTETTDVLGEQAGESIDTIIREKIITGTNVQYAGGKTSTATITSADKISADEIKKAVRTLKKNKAKPCAGAYYIGIIDPDVAFDLMSDPLWLDVSKYNGGENIMDGEIGKLMGVRFIETTQVAVKNESSNVSVHCCMILGKDAYAITDIKNSAKKPSVFVKALGSGGTSDPLNQRGTIGWKAMFTTTITNQLAMVRLECAVSA